jgi:hypothetical protein
LLICHLNNEFSVTYIITFFTVECSKIKSHFGESQLSIRRRIISIILNHFSDELNEITEFSFQTFI